MAKTTSKIQVTGRSVAYIQNVGKGGKLSKPKPVVVTMVRSSAGAPGAASAPKKKIRKRRK